MEFSSLSDSAVLAELGERIRRERLNQNRTQAELAADARVGLNVIKRLETGDGCTVSSLIRIARALGEIDALDSLFPEPGVSPLQLARLAGRRRKQASGGRGRRKGSGNG